MSKLGVYIIHNNNYKLVDTIDLPYELNKDDFKELPFSVKIVNDTDKDIFPFYVKESEFTPHFKTCVLPGTEVVEEILDIKKVQVLEEGVTKEILGGLIDFYDVTTQTEVGAYIDLNSPYVKTQKNSSFFTEWFYDYYFKTLIYNDNFLNKLNNGRTYFLISNDYEDFLGLLTLRKGRSDLNVTEFNIKNLIKSKFPNIREKLDISEEDG